MELSNWQIAGEVANMITAMAAAFAAFQAWKGLSTWRLELIGRRKAELAEEVLSGFYQAFDTIKSIRSPLSFPEQESESRVRNQAETDDQTRQLDSYYVPIARIEQRSEFFSDLLAKKYAMKALFGNQVDVPFNTLNQTLNEKQNAASGMMRSAQRPNGREFSDAMNQRWEEWENIIWWSSEDDQIEINLLEAIEKIQTICGPILEVRK